MIKMNKKGNFVGLIMSLIIMVTILAVAYGLYLGFEYKNEVKDFCEIQGGSYEYSQGDYYCYKLENNEYVEYKIVELNDELVLIK